MFLDQISWGTMHPKSDIRHTRPCSTCPLQSLRLRSEKQTCQIFTIPVVCCDNAYLAAWSPKEPIKMAKALTWGSLVRIWANRAGFIPYRDRLASLKMITKYSSASSLVMSLMACSVPSRVWSPLMQNCEWACMVWREEPGRRSHGWATPFHKHNDFSMTVCQCAGLTFLRNR